MLTYVNKQSIIRNTWWSLDAIRLLVIFVAFAFVTFPGTANKSLY